MSSIALFYSLFTAEKEVRETLSSVTGYKIVDDEAIISEVAQKHSIDQDKVARALYGPVSIFNKFTMEREQITAWLKLAVAQRLNTSGQIFSGFIAQLIPPTITHVLKVGIFDERAHRIKRAVKEGMTEKGATKRIKNNDIHATDWTDFLYKKGAFDSSLYDMVIPLSGGTPEDTVQLILENYNRPAVQETEESMQAVADMLTAAKVEVALTKKGYTQDVACQDGKVTLLLNKSVLNFAKLENSLQEIASGVDAVREVEVKTGEDYHVSIYRDQEFTLPPKVLLVDDEQEFVQTLSERLNTRNYGSHPVFTGMEALDLLNTERPDVMVLDLKMPGMDGVEVLQKTKAAQPEVEIIILTGHGSEKDRDNCMQLGAFAYLQKPVDISELTEVIDRAHKKVAADKLAHI